MSQNERTRKSKHMTDHNRSDASEGELYVSLVSYLSAERDKGQYGGARGVLEQPVKKTEERCGLDPEDTISEELLAVKRERDEWRECARGLAAVVHYLHPTLREEADGFFTEKAALSKFDLLEKAKTTT